MLIAEMTWSANYDVVLFLRTELELGLTFALIAAHASNREKFQRNRSNARRAYDTARRFLRRVALSDDEHAEFHEMLDELERRLRVLESVDAHAPTVELNFTARF